jgi:hypothetical protein
VFHDQADNARNDQQQRQAVETMTAAVMAKAMMVVAVPVMAAMPAAAFFIAGFVERKFIAHPDIQFAHSVSFWRPDLAAKENIINNSSYFKLTHQIIVIIT